MPIYEYACAKCGHQFEALQSVNDAPLTTCPSCGEEGVKKGLFSAPNFQLKGKGWYKTDYAKPSAKSGKDNADKPHKDKASD